MKKIASLFKNIQAFSFLFGASFGAAIGLVLFSYMVPSGLRMTALYHSKISNIQEKKNNQQMKMMYPSSNGGMDHSMHQAGSNPYVMAKVTSEKQFLEDMKLHHEAAIIMAQQVLVLKVIRPEVKDLANDIIRAQTTEIKMMKDWLTQ